MRAWACGAVAVLLLVLCGCPRKRPPPAGLEVTFFDVGQGDAALIRTPEDDTVLIDTGTNGRLTALLRAAGVSKIDLLVLSHSHRDHTGGLGAIAKSFPIDEIWYSALEPTPRPAALPARAVAALAGQQKQLHSLRLTVLNPDPRAQRPRSQGFNHNNNSLVVRAETAAARYLFPGDCELECWDELFRQHRAELRSDVLKAAHHGSNNGTNSGVLINVRPKTFIVSCGRNNEYHHPNALVLTLAAKAGAQVLRTDEAGTIACAGTVCRPQ